MPRIKVKDKNLKNQIKKIILSNKQDGFIPDIITAHFYYPHLDMVIKLSDFYHAKSCIVVHEQGIDLNKIYGRNLRSMLDKINIWGYRSSPIREKFQSLYNINGKAFNCYSGIPIAFLPKSTIKKTFSLPLRHFIYVGSFIKRKHPLELAQALCKLNYNDWHIDYVGSGEYVQKTKDYLKSKESSSNATFWGQLERDKVQALLNEAECFIMISTNETFGLVYLEAMAKGLVTIASRHEGMDGIIIDGENGFLCKAGDKNELSFIINKINLLSDIELSRISNNAILTASKLTDNKVAEYYINHLINPEVNQ